MELHLDTDIGGDADDACALAMLLGWPGVDVVGITTNIDLGGHRAGCAVECLKLAGREDIPVAAGAGASLTTLASPMGRSSDPNYWSAPPPPRTGPPGAALDMLLESIQRGATIVAIGAATNLALLEVARPGSLGDASVVMMGGWVHPPAAGLPGWGPEEDWNVQCDTRAAEILASAAGELTLVTLPVCMGSHLRAAQLPRLRGSGRLGDLVAHHSEAWAAEKDMSALASAHPGLPDDLVNFQWDPVTCAVAAGWSGASSEDLRLRPSMRGETLHWIEAAEGRVIRVVVGLDTEDFDERFLASVEAAQR